MTAVSGMSSALPSRSSQRGFQASFLRLPSGFFGLRPFLERLELSLYVRSVLFVLPTGRIQGALHVVDGLLPPLALLTLSGFFLRAFALAAFLLLLESERCLPISRLVRGPHRLLLRLTPHRPAACLIRNVVASQIRRQLGVLFERPAGTDGTLQNDARRSHGRRDDVGILAFLRRALVKRLLSAPHASRAAFIDGAATARSKKPSEVWYVFSFLAIPALSCAAAG
jgi:hypothetical protein